MAKKRKKDKEPKEEYEFTPPEFDEKEFLRKELRDTRTVFLTVGYAALFGLVAFILSLISERLMIVGLGLLFGGLVSLKYVYPLLKVKIEEFQKKNWAGNIAWFFLTFLAVWVLLLNFPFSDHADPDIEKLVMWVHDETRDNFTAIDYEYVDSMGTYIWVPRGGEILSGLIHADAAFSINITARISDNGNLRSVEIAFGSATSAYRPMVSEGDYRYGFVVDGEDLNEGFLTFFIRATDDHGNTVTFSPVAIPIAA
jgi:hypothetical protein